MKKKDMIEILNDIRKAYQADALRSAFALALTLPDICGQKEYPDEDCGTRYALWIDNYFEDSQKSAVFDFVVSDDKEIAREVLMDGKTYYRLRCTYLHSGSTILSKNSSDYPEFYFITTSTEDESMYANMLISIKEKRILFVDIRNEIDRLLHSAIQYYKSHLSEFENNKLEIIDLERNLESIRKNNRKTYESINETVEKLIENQAGYDGKEEATESCIRKL